MEINFCLENILKNSKDISQRLNSISREEEVENLKKIYSKRYLIETKLVTEEEYKNLNNK